MAWWRQDIQHNDIYHIGKIMIPLMPVTYIFTVMLSFVGFSALMQNAITILSIVMLSVIMMRFIMEGVFS
jgi:hypothetical protein